MDSADRLVELVAKGLWAEGRERLGITAGPLPKGRLDFRVEARKLLTALTADKARDEALEDDFPAMIACVLAESRMRRMLPQLADHISGDAILPDANDVEDAEQVAQAIRSLKGAAK